MHSVDLNYVRQPSAVPTDEFYGLQWHYRQIEMPAAWDLAAADSGVRVAVLDTGVVADHPDLSTQLVDDGYDFIQDLVTANDGDGCDADPDDPGDLSPGGSSYHGTHVAGTVAAATSLQPAALEEGVAGVAWNARVMPLRVLGVGGGTDFDIMQALLHAVGRSNDCSDGADTPARIINMSLGGPGYNQAFQDLVLELRQDEGTIFVAAAGNESSSQPSYPAAYNGVISVSATGPTQALAPYSNHGPSVDVAAPGGDFARDVEGDGFPDGVLSTFYDEEQGEFVYAFYQGTSMATPHVAGVLALMLGINPAITPIDVDNWLAARPRLLTRDIGPADAFGHGLIDAALAVDTASTQAGGGGLLLPVLSVDPGTLNFGLIADEFILTVSNSGNDEIPIVVSNVDTQADDFGEWLDVEPVTVDANGLGTYRVTVNRGVLTDGIYTGHVSVESDAGGAEVSVIMQVGSLSEEDASAGYHFVLLVDPLTFETIEALEVGVDAGRYSFQFEDVDEGEFLIIAGTDSDYDLLICDTGEACGAFPTTESIQSVVVERDRNLDFVTGFSIPFTGAFSSAQMGEQGGFSRVPRGRD